MPTSFSLLRTGPGRCAGFATPSGRAVALSCPPDAAVLSTWFGGQAGDGPEHAIIAIVLGFALEMWIFNANRECVFRDPCLWTILSIILTH